MTQEQKQMQLRVGAEGPSVAIYINEIGIFLLPDDAVSVAAHILNSSGIARKAMMDMIAQQNRPPEPEKPNGEIGDAVISGDAEQG